MLHLSFNSLLFAYPRTVFVSREALLREIGWDDLIKNPDYENTCATRISLALIKCAVHIPGARMPIRKGPYKNRLIEPGQGKLSHILALPSMLGMPEKYPMAKARDAIEGRNGIVSFFRLIPGLYEGGHIDIVSPSFGIAACGSGCHWTSGETWFWPLK